MDGVHVLLPKKLSEEHKRKIGLKSKGRKLPTGSNHHNWKDDKVKYRALHQWVNKYLPKPNLCQMCNENPSTDLANISGNYLRDLNDWQYLCRSCHCKSDSRIRNITIKLGKVNQW